MVERGGIVMGGDGAFCGPADSAWDASKRAFGERRKRNAEGVIHLIQAEEAEGG